MSDYYIVGAQSKCPACGWKIDPDAYRCPKCLIYFCFKCRKRVLKGDDQFQCVNQKCDRHGKLVCSACTVIVPKYRDDIETITTSGDGGLGIMAAIVGSIVGIACIWLWSVDPLFAICIGLLSALLIIIFDPLDRMNSGAPITLSERPIRQLVRRDRCCIKCKRPIEFL